MGSQGKTEEDSVSEDEERDDTGNQRSRDPS